MLSRFDSNIIQARVYELYYESKKRLKLFLQVAIFDIYITCDNWIFFNRLSILAIVVYFVDETIQ